MPVARMLHAAPVCAPVPALVLCGSLDQTTPPALARELARGIPGAQFREIVGSGHCLLLEQPAELVAAIQAFLVQHFSSPDPRKNS